MRGVFGTEKRAEAGRTGFGNGVKVTAGALAMAQSSSCR